MTNLTTKQKKAKERVKKPKGMVHVASNEEMGAKLWISNGKGGFIHSLKELEEMLPKEET